MWGYIAAEQAFYEKHIVPSLYVRVYRLKSTGARRNSGSLIICEGISTLYRQRTQDAWFPHYMWGYIGIKRAWPCGRAVPSLYVRVYRRKVLHYFVKESSLIICEGISPLSDRMASTIRFPHYMWGYIAISRTFKPDTVVPSLYVRVYRAAKPFISTLDGSLIICEGISYK